MQYRVVRPGRLPVRRAVGRCGADRRWRESALTRALAGRAIDDVLTTGRAEVAERMRREVQERADAQGLGVSIRAVRLGRVAPPVPVAPAFADAARARSDRRQAVTRAEEYRDRALADARGLAREIADRAAGRFDRLVQGARGEADRFTKVLAESARTPAPPASGSTSKPSPSSSRGSPARSSSRRGRTSTSACSPSHKWRLFADHHHDLS